MDQTELREASDPCLDFDPDPEAAAAAALRKSQIHAGIAINLVVALSSSLSSSSTIRQHPIAHPSRFSSCQNLSYIQVDNLINASSHLGSTEPGLIFPHLETSSADQPGSQQINLVRSRYDKLLSAFLRLRNPPSASEVPSA
ncbi:uncharacterized protein UBRO_00580 [Ustilago bromivora]|uniref:Uncharacterized protein n=1 Tax=Ustilago bromivora TaxID=307758 RepID=A0A1K0FXA6_9BASI|nr:uncharacterized protein UBRO_00580 [Ustilago bromivora]SYW79166.1 uncharacterized protein UBRO2_02850 [Ustilago bromivora]